jgi:ferredoxin
MKRTIIKIDDKLCDGCGDCVNGCHEGALQMIDGKAKLVSELYCDGLGACIGECHTGAITLEEREAEPYEEIAVMDRLSTEGEKVIMAHLKHLKDHNEMGFFKQAVEYINLNALKVDLSKLNENNKPMFSIQNNENHAPQGGGCPGSRNMTFDNAGSAGNDSDVNLKSQLTHWPIQLHLANPMASHFAGSDVVLAADCVPFSMANFHGKYLKDKKLIIACPKLDSNKQVYVEKLINMIDGSKINTLTVVIMEVPCCSGLLQLAKTATDAAQRKVPLKCAVISIGGDVLEEGWV